MRLLSLAPSNTEILYCLGLEDEIIGVTAYCDYPPEAKTKPRVGSWITTDPERIRKLKPDLIFTCYFLPESLKNWHGPGEVVHIEPKTLEDIYNSIKILGKVTKRVRVAEKIIQELQREFERIHKNQPRTMTKNILRESVANREVTTRDSSRLRLNSKPKVYMEEWPVPPFVSGNWVPELVEIAGGIPVIAKKGKLSFEVQIDTLMSSDPDIMIFHWCGFGKRFRKQIVLDRPGWTKLKAVRNDKLYFIDDSLLNRPGPRLTQGTKKIQEILALR